MVLKLVKTTRKEKQFFRACLKVRTTVRFDGRGNIRKKTKMKTVAFYNTYT